MSKKKILIIVENAVAPFDRRVWHEARTLREEGYQVTVLCPRGETRAKGHEVIDGIRVYRYPGRCNFGSVAGLIFEYCSALCWQFVYSLWIYLRRGFHVIQGCNPPDTIFLISIPYRVFGVKYIFDHHDVVPELFYAKYGSRGLLYEAQLWLERLTFQRSSVVITTNESYRNIAVQRGGVDPRNVFVVRNGPDLENFRPVAPNAALRHGKPYLIGYVGTMGVQDGLDMLLEVVEYVKRLGRQDIHFTCVGGGPEVDRLRRMAGVKGIGEMVDFPGFISHGRLLEILSTADVCVNPDKPCEMNDISTMIKVLEYMALGKPIVQCDFKEGRVSAMDASLYADTRNPVPDLAKKILWLLENPEERRRMGEFGRRRVEEALAWKYSVPNLLAAYERVFSGAEG